MSDQRNDERKRRMEEVRGLRERVAALEAEGEKRRDAEKSLKAREAQWRSLINNAQVGIFRTRLSDGTILQANPRLAEMLGFESPEELLGMKTLELYVNPEVRGHLLSALRGEGHVRNYQMQLRRKDGEKIWVEGSGWISEDGEGLEGLMVDITVRRRAEAALRQSEERQRDLIEHNADALVVVDQDGVIQLVNQAGENLFQKSRKDLVGTRFPFSTETGTEIEFQGGEEGSAEGPRSRVAELRAVEIYWDDAPARLVSLRDVTQRRWAEQELKRLATAIEQAAESIVITNTFGQIDYVNPAFERVSGYTREEAIGKSPGILQSGMQDETFYRDMWFVLQRGQVWTGHLVNRRKDGSLFEEEATISPIHSPAGEIMGYVAVKRDVTEEAHLESQLRQAQKMEAVGQLAGGVAHDFNNLLQAILGHLDLALEDLDGDHPVRPDLEQVRLAGERASTLVRQLLAFSRYERMRPEVLSVNDIISNLLKMMRRLIGDHIELDLRLADELDSVRADPGQIEQVLTNLCVNARDAMPSGGRILVETGNAELGVSDCEGYPWARPGRYVLVRVSDTGTGIRPEDVDRIFEPFFTTKGTEKGTGLGLSVVYGIIKGHRGIIQVDSVPEEGTVFRIYLPIISRLESAGSGEDEDPVVGGTETILLAEDDSQVRDLAHRILSRSGYRLILARSGEEAKAAFDRHRDRIDGAILDVLMPGGSGLDVREHMRAARPGFPVLFTSGYSQTGDDPLTQDSLEPAEILRKPYSANALLRRLRSVLDGSRPAGSD